MAVPARLTVLHSLSSFLVSSAGALYQVEGHGQEIQPYSPNPRALLPEASLPQFYSSPTTLVPRTHRIMEESAGNLYDMGVAGTESRRNIQALDTYAMVPDDTLQ